MDKQLHIICHDNPWPTGHGGLMDLGYKLKALHQAGVKIHLHIFGKKSSHDHMLQNWCQEVNYYPRSIKSWLFHPFLPYIVSSRINVQLIHHLKKDHFPILFEGIHTCYPLLYDNIKDRKIAIRVHNIENIYYHHLATNERNPFKKIYYHIESVLLKRLELLLYSNHTLWTVSEKDADILKNNFRSKDVSFMPVFIPWDQVKAQKGKGSYCLYHGNLSVNENAEAATWLLKNIFSTLKIPFVIAGKNPPAHLTQLAHQYSHTCLVANPSDFELDDMIRKAQLHILPSFNDTGVKLKLLHALFNGRFCLTNQNAVSGSGVEELCIHYEDTFDCREKVEKLYNENFTEEDIQKRSTFLQQKYNSQKSIETILRWLS